MRAAAQSAARAGFCVTGMDLFGDRDTLAACHQHLFIATASAVNASQTGSHPETEMALSKFAGAEKTVPIVEVGGLHGGGQNAAESLSQWFGRRFPVYAAALKVRKQLENPELLRRLAASAGMRFPRTLDKWSGPAIPPPDGPWLVKKRGASGGLGIRWFGAGQSITSDQFLQQWVAARSYGATLLSSGDDVVLLGVCRSLFSRRSGMPFVYVGSYGPIPVSAEICELLRRLGRQVVAQTGLVGLFNVDFLLDAQNTGWLLEINPRWSGSSELVERHLIDCRVLGPNASLFEHMIAATQGQIASTTLRRHTEVTAERQPAYVKRILFAGAEVSFHERLVTNLTRLAARYRATIHDIPADGSVIRRAEPMLTVISSIEANEKNPMRKHRVLHQKIQSAIKRVSG